MAEVRHLRLNISRKSLLVLGFSDFIANGDWAGPGVTKKAAPFGATLFQEAEWRESEETSLTPLWGTETDRVRCREHRE